MRYYRGWRSAIMTTCTYCAMNRSSRRIFHSLIIMLIVPLIVYILMGAWEEYATLPPLLAPSPPQMSVISLYPSHLPLINLPMFSYRINNDVCGDDNVFIVVVIHSHPANRERRDVMRTTIPSEDLRDLKMRRLFLLGRAEWSDQAEYNKTSQDVISEENVLHRDILQGEFKEHYHNLTYKHVMGLQWAIKYCPQARFVIKMDDDIIVDLYQWRDYLKYRYDDRKNLILGLLQVETKPVRDRKSKWHVSKEEYRNNIYPNFVSGWAYAITLDAARKIVLASQAIEYFWIDDVYVTGILANNTGVKVEGLNRFYTLHLGHMECCISLPRAAEFVCDFFVGPSEGDTAMMGSVLSHARNCFVSPCARRPLQASVPKTCITAQIAPLAPAGRGRGEVIRVY